jgi:cell division protein FtsL
VLNLKKEIIALYVIVIVMILLVATAITELKSTVDDYEDRIVELESTVDDYEDRIAELERKADLTYDFMTKQQEVNDIFAKRLGINY